MRALEKLTNPSPLVHFITNRVTINDMANITLAFGGKPLMAEELKEIEDITPHVNTLVINIGTLNEAHFPTMRKACEVATKHNIPIILDPVGAGASAVRKEISLELLNNYNITVIKGNLAEIKTLLDLSSEAVGIDCLDEINGETPAIARACSKKFHCVTAITGSEDIIADENQYTKLNWDVPKLTYVTGTGCMISAIIGVYMGQGYTPFEASAYGIASMSYAGSIADDTKAPLEALGSFKVKLFDAFYHATPTHIDANGGIKNYDFKG